MYVCVWMYVCMSLCMYAYMLYACMYVYVHMYAYVKSHDSYFMELIIYKIDTANNIQAI